MFYVICVIIFFTINLNLTRSFKGTPFRRCVPGGIGRVVGRLEEIGGGFSRQRSTRADICAQVSCSRWRYWSTWTTWLESRTVSLNGAVCVQNETFIINALLQQWKLTLFHLIVIIVVIIPSLSYEFINTFVLKNVFFYFVHF